jgi:hypothetical protein
MIHMLLRTVYARQRVHLVCVRVCVRARVCVRVRVRVCLYDVCVCMYVLQK